MNETPILGPGPHKLRWAAATGLTISGLLVVLLGILVILGFGAGQADTISALMEESDVWENGAVATEPHVHENWSSSGSMIDSYTIPVDWIDGDGEYQETEQSFSTFLGSVDENEALEVRYLSTDDGYAIATSWSESVRFSRWSAAFVVFLFGLVFAALALLLGIGVMKQARQRIRTAKNAKEVWLRVVNVMNDKSDGSAEQIFTLFDEEKETEFMERFKKGPPLTLGPDEGHVLGLRRGDEGVMIVRHDLYPLEKDSGEAKAIRERASRAKAPSQA